MISHLSRWFRLQIEHLQLQEWISNKKRWDDTFTTIRSYCKNETVILHSLRYKNEVARHIALSIQILWKAMSQITSMLHEGTWCSLTKSLFWSSQQSSSIVSQYCVHAASSYPSFFSHSSKWLDPTRNPPKKHESDVKQWVTPPHSSGGGRRGGGARHVGHT